MDFLNGLREFLKLEIDNESKGVENYTEEETDNFVKFSVLKVVNNFNFSIETVVFKNSKSVSISLYSDIKVLSKEKLIDSVNAFNLISYDCPIRGNYDGGLVFECNLNGDDIKSHMDIEKVITYLIGVVNIYLDNLFWNGIITHKTYIKEVSKPLVLEGDEEMVETVLKLNLENLENRLSILKESDVVKENVLDFGKAYVGGNCVVVYVDLKVNGKVNCLCVSDDIACLYEGSFKDIEFDLDDVILWESSDYGSVSDDEDEASVSLCLSQDNKAYDYPIEVYEFASLLVLKHILL